MRFGKFPSPSAKVGNGGTLAAFEQIGRFKIGNAQNFIDTRRRKGRRIQKAGKRFPVGNRVFETGTNERERIGKEVTNRKRFFGEESGIYAQLKTRHGGPDTDKRRIVPKRDNAEMRRANFGKSIVQNIQFLVIENEIETFRRFSVVSQAPVHLADGDDSVPHFRGIEKPKNLVKARGEIEAIIEAQNSIVTTPGNQTFHSVHGFGTMFEINAEESQQSGRVLPVIPTPRTSEVYIRAARVIPEKLPADLAKNVPVGILDLVDPDKGLVRASHFAEIDKEEIPAEEGTNVRIRNARQHGISAGRHTAADSEADAQIVRTMRKQKAHYSEK